MTRSNNGTGPVEVNLPYVDAFEDRHKRWRYYFRRRGKRVALKGEPGSTEFAASYNAALAASEKATIAPRAAKDTLDELRETYFGSAEFRNLRPSTQRELRYVIEGVCRRKNKHGELWGTLPHKRFETKHILKIRDELGEKPGAANKFVRSISQWMGWAVSRKMRAENPAKGIKLLKGGRFRAWTDEELLAFEERWPLGTIERTGYALALYTAQRRADLTALKWSSIAGDVMRVRQRKTGTYLEIHMHPELRKALRAVKARSEEAILAGKRGAALNEVTFGHIMAEAIDAAGLPDDLVLHGLRKTAARIVAETGGKVASMTGHLTESMVREYTRDADQKIQSKAAVIAWSKARRRRKANRS